MKAMELDLTGWVRNLPDGDVELVVCGADDKVSEFIEWLWKGPPAARIESVRCKDIESQVFESFGVR
ncbi:MAG: hypothetical protein BMS9Abin15_0437 [Gammaproteobacteria bacterium]|nr:MAG: hypothetical protein BMS9Abin15_0437 [Gammaproteobacteria bacterium]